VVSVRDFGALPDDDLDDTAAIQKALDALAPNQWLVFPAGRYLHNKRLNVRTRGAVLWSDGATLHATNPDDQAVLLSADGASIYNFTLTAKTLERKTAPWQSRIAVFDRVERAAPLMGNVIQGNRIIESGPVGSEGANSASSAAIFLYRAQNFLVAGNEVRRSLADGIHLTAGTRDGRVLKNTVRETGDDMIAMVSYLGTGDWTTADLARSIADATTGRDLQLVRNVLVDGNDVSGNYWGRGITVVGGADITIRNNTIARTAMAAGILLAREASYTTWGVGNVLIEDNKIADIETTAPSYTPASWTSGAFRTGHGAIEVHAMLLDDEASSATLAPLLAIRDVRFARNTVRGAGYDGVRIGMGSGLAGMLNGTGAGGLPKVRAYYGGRTERIELNTLALDRVSGNALRLRSAPADAACSGVTVNGSPLPEGTCTGKAPVVTGTVLACSP
jgi:parallel beta-helix repeat protein